MTTVVPAPTLPSDLQQLLAAVTVDAAIPARWPDYRVLAIVAHGLRSAADVADASAETDSPLARAEAAVRAQGAVDWTAHPHVAQWLDAFRAFGAKPKRTSPSVLALLRRVEGGLPRIDPITDLYNAVSIGHVLPVGGEDLTAYAGAPRLIVAAGDEAFDTVDRGEPVIDHPAPGEVVWRDDVGVTCRRWNWRQGVRTRIAPTTETALFLLEALGAMSDEALLAAGADLMAELRAIAPDVALGSRLLPAPPSDRG